MTNSGWSELGSVPTANLSPTRIELHWAAQVLSATADATLEHRPDDSHSNTTWSSQSRSLVGRALPGGVHVALNLLTQSLQLLTDGRSVRSQLVLQGQTLAELMEWVRTHLTEEFAIKPEPMKLRDYEMPDHAVGRSGAAFGPVDAEASTELARYFDNAHQMLHGLVRSQNLSANIAIWPHHFDMGGIFILDRDKPFEEARQIGFGLSPGDHNYDEPYFYVTPWPIREGASLPDLPSGGLWHTEGFTGAILRAQSMVESPQDQRQRVEAFLKSALQAANELIPETT